MQRRAWRLKIAARGPTRAAGPLAAWGVACARAWGGAGEACGGRLGGRQPSRRALTRQPPGILQEVVYPVNEAIARRLGMM